MLDKLKREKHLDRWSLTQLGDNKGMFVFEFANKMNKSLNTVAAHRNDVGGDTGMQWRAYQGQVKASG